MESKILIEKILKIIFLAFFQEGNLDRKSLRSSPCERHTRRGAQAAGKRCSRSDVTVRPADAALSDVMAARATLPDTRGTASPTG